MGKRPRRRDKEENLNRGRWTPEEDKILIEYMKKNKPGRWIFIPKRAGLRRCYKSVRSRWVNYLCPDVNHDPFTPGEDRIIMEMQSTIGNRWSAIASQLPGRTDNQIKNHWSTNLKNRSLESDYAKRNHLSDFKATKDAHEKLLTIWNSEIGESFRRLYNVADNASTATDSSTCRTKSLVPFSSTFTGVVGAENGANMIEPMEPDSSSSSNLEVQGDTLDWFRSEFPEFFH